MGPAWTDCWPPNLERDRRVRAQVKIPLGAGAFSYFIEVEDTAGAFTDFMESQRPPRFDVFDREPLASE